MEKRAHILVVDDEQAIADLVVNLLVAEGMDALACYSGQAALDMLARTPFDLAIVDIMMPGIDGFELCVRMRQMRDIPVIFLSAKDEEADQVVGFTLGAEDYVTKPFRPRELVARVKARLRRRQAVPQASSTLLSAGAIEVDLRTHLATLHGEPLHLTPKEFAILAILAQSVGSPVSAADLFEGAWHERFDDAAANTVMVHIRRLTLPRRSSKPPGASATSCAARPATPAMALKSEQARVLRRRVLGGLIRNLLLFSGAFALACLVIETFMVPSIANWVADSTSSWRTLNSSEQFQQILTDQGLLDDANLFDLWVNEAVESGYSNDAGTIAEVQGEVNEMEDALAEYASMMADSPENAEAAAAYAKERAEKLGADVAVASGTNAAAIGDTSAFIDDVAPLDAETDGAPDDKTLWAVPLLPYQTILTAEGIFTDEASAAHAMAALRVSASLQELGLSLPEAQTFMTPETTVDVATRILVSAAVLGYDQPTLNDLLQSAFRQSQEQAYSAWLDLTSAEEARALGVSDDHPVWQVQYGEDGVYRMRDVATYTFVKSFKLPLALLVFVAGWLVIILRALNRSLRYFDELSGAVGRLLADKDAPIELPADLSIARNELAVIRSQSLADERAAHAAEQRKNELVAYLAHDIRTPLTSVLGYLDLLRETTDLPRETLRKYADIAYSKAERLESLINEFFEITRYNLSAIPIERETVGVRLFCQQVAEAFFPEAAARNIRITVDAAGAGQFFIDPDKLARALGNVLRNAVAYADANSVIAIAARQDARTTTITVANRGREISDAHLETIFEKFYREDGARSSKKGGAGLGLAIAREIVVAHHGDIEAASERGVTVFTLRIPTQGEEIEGAAAAPRIPGAPEGLQRPVAPVPPRTARPAGVRAISTPPSATTRRGASARPNPQHPVGERTHAPRQGTSPLNPRNARHGQVPARKTVRDNDATPRRRGLSR